MTLMYYNTLLAYQRRAAMTQFSYSSSFSLVLLGLYIDQLNYKAITYDIFINKLSVVND